MRKKDNPNSAVSSETHYSASPSEVVPSLPSLAPSSPPPPPRVTADVASRNCSRLLFPVRSSPTVLEAAVPTASRLASFLRRAAAVPPRRLCSTSFQPFSAPVPPRPTLLCSSSAVHHPPRLQFRSGPDDLFSSSTASSLPSAPLPLCSRSDRNSKGL
ncbi:hypothetical protein S245_020111 [Arachis hypogaea]